ncbi:MAG: quinolinate synthase NadA [Candidatus Omnitrophota bacterium]|nr:quinolinate synthase NadA [Candidatus Omnitrophota bacterium]MBU1524505.1 quinolinate synthase NadA [Candidatus Omnitrophota bacterium]MBU2436315.1 quinolinate synthase NadA [Candidatus Omnitrophota bacterium]
MEIIEKIKKLKKERNAVILVHNYQLPEIQELADFTGDSLGLSIEASKTKAEVIVFCGVYFMAETAKILSPQKTVLIPDRDAGCPMADMITAKQLCSLKEKHPQAKVLCYVNTPADVKAESDLCCTSANAVKMVKEALAGEKEVIFVPDKYLADYVSTQTNRNFITWDGYCPSHVKILPQDIRKQKELYPHALTLAHPECTRDVIKLADKVLSTEGMCRYVKETNSQEFIIGTEPGIIYRLKKENPYKIFYPASELAVCPNMKLTTQEKVLWCLEDLKYEIKIPEQTILRAKKSIQKMLRLHN